MRRITPLLVALLFFAAAVVAQPRDLNGYPIKILSGEQLLLTTGNKVVHRIEIRGIRVPPLTSYLGQSAKRHLRMLTAGHLIQVVDIGQQNPDLLKGRLLYGGSDLGFRMIKAGLAVTEPSELRKQDLPAYQQAQQQARNSGIGIWGRGSR
ncbi:MAG: thermonuclease family protein [Sedimenticola sp.]